MGDKNIPVISVATPRTEEEAAAAEAAPAAAGDVEMIKEKKEEGEEGAAPAKGEKAPAKGAAKGAEKAPAAAAGKAAAAAGRSRREEEIIVADRRRRAACAIPAHGECYFSSWVWAIRARNTRRRATTPGLCWSKNWRHDGRRIGRAKRNFSARIAKCEQDGKRVLLCQPQTFMNLSGEAVGTLKNFYQLPLKQLLVAVDDADLPLGEIRLRASGSSGGHHGLESIEQHMATREFARLRIGIGAGERRAGDHGSRAGAFQRGRERR